MKVLIRAGEALQRREASTVVMVYRLGGGKTVVEVVSDPQLDDQSKAENLIYALHSLSGRLAGITDGSEQL